MEQVNYEKLLPTEPPADIINTYFEQFKADNAYIIYKGVNMTEPLTGDKYAAVGCFCSSCHNSWIAERVYAGCFNGYPSAPFGFVGQDADGNPTHVASFDRTYCPVCGASAEALHTSAFSYYSFGCRRYLTSFYPCTWFRVELDNGTVRIALIKWYVRIFLDKEALYSCDSLPDECYVFEDRKIVRLCGWFNSSFGNYARNGNWYQRKRFDDMLGIVGRDMIEPITPDILAGTSLENSKLDIYIGCSDKVCPVSYLSLFLRNNYVENLVLQGAAEFVNSALKSLQHTYYSNHLGSVNRLFFTMRREPRPAQLLGLNKDEYRVMLRDEWSYRDLEFFNSFCGGMKAEDLSLIRPFSYDSINSFLKAFPDADIVRVCRYLTRQKETLSEENIISLEYLRDYWDTLRKLEADLTDCYFLFPRNLVIAHDRSVARVKYKEDEKLFALFSSRTEELSRFAFESDGLFIRPAGSQAELIAEGSSLHHCVASYVQRHADGKTAIFFIRHTMEPDISYFTLELDEKNLTVKQNRGCRNCARTPEVEAFEAKWLEHIRNLRKEEKKNGNRHSKSEHNRKRGGKTAA